MRTIRRLSQLIFLLLFLYLFLNTLPEFQHERYVVDSFLPVNLFLIADPLYLFSVTISAKEILPVNFLPMLVILGITLVFGRAFCGWICPLGTLIDYSAHVIKPKPQNPRQVPHHNFKYYLLIGLVVLGILGVNLIGIFDPISLTLRSFALSIFPALSFLISRGLSILQGIPWVGEIFYRLYNSWIENVQGSLPPYFSHAWLYLVVFLAVLLLVRLQARFWCRYLCPLGAFLGLIGQTAWIKRRVTTRCNECSACATQCRMNSIKEPARAFDLRECVLCLDCQYICPEEAVMFSTPTVEGWAEETPISLSRRGLLRSLGLSVVLLPLIGMGKWRQIHIRINKPLRPPGVTDEDKFLELCVRCGECMKVCPQTALQPALLEAGVEGLWTPLLKPRIGYCEHNCNLCGQVCPSAAIPALSLPVKQQQKMGLAVINQNTCWPWASNIPCLVCEEACPVSPKSIIFEEKEVQLENGNKITLKLPKVQKDRCVGCGTCENKCPIVNSAIVVTPLE